MIRRKGLAQTCFFVDVNYYCRHLRQHVYQMPPTIVVQKGNYAWSFCSRLATIMEGRSASSMPLFTPGACSWHGMRIKRSPTTSHTLYPGFDNPVINLLTFYPCSQVRYTSV
jgi:hypothetical protein